MRRTDLKVEAGTRERLDRYLSDTAQVATRSQIQRLVKQGMVLVGGRRVKPSYRLKGGESVQVTIPDPEPSGLEPEAIPLDVVWEDECLLVVNKPAGMVVHPGGGVRRGTLVNALLARCKDLSGIGGVLRPGIVHRLDKGTSGLVIVAKDDASHVALSQALKARQIKRTYEAVVWGTPAAREGRIETLVGRSPRDRKKMTVLESSGRLAATSYRVAEELGPASRLILNLETGRTHQIRVHLAHMGHPVLGDPTYGGRRPRFRNVGRAEVGRLKHLLDLMPRQALHARELRFVHPIKGDEIRLAAPVPDDMQELLDTLRRWKASN